MSTARHLAVVDQLCFRDFSREHGDSGAVFGGPGHHIAVLRTSDGFWEDGGTGQEEVRDQYEAERDALGQRLTERWGSPRIFGLGTVFFRCEQYGEEIPEPWSSLSCHVPDVHVWRAHGRWIALGVSQWQEELPYQLLVVVTDVDPP